MRQASWLHGLRLFADSPVWGVGFGVWGTPRVQPGIVNPDPHNAYIRILAFYGILGGGFFAYMIYVIYASLLRSAKDLGEKFEFWRPYFTAALTALLTMNLFNSYFFDRYLYLVPDNLIRGLYKFLSDVAILGVAAKESGSAIKEDILIFFVERQKVIDQVLGVNPCSLLFIDCSKHHADFHGLATFGFRPHIEKMPMPQTNQIICTRSSERGPGRSRRIFFEMPSLRIMWPRRN